MPDADSSRADILNAVRSRRTAPAELPALNGAWITYADRVQQFAETLRGVGGTCREVRDESQLRDELAQLELMTTARKICSLVPGAAQGTFDLAQVDDPHTLEDVDVAIARGEFAIAENGAVWVTDRDMKHRAILFITQHLVLVVPRDQVIDNMHQAYERLAFAGAGFGVFLSGPSKTADIEQSLVIGAHGPRSLTVFLVG
ncbi:MAG TPA: LUD domain-containing protein [Planctomycetaceae bacterium]|jgi:L-lactate dehydrogenase complex protein LldG